MKKKGTTSCCEKSGFVKERFIFRIPKSNRGQARKKLTVENLVRGFLERRIKWPKEKGKNRHCGSESSVALSFPKGWKISLDPCARALPVFGWDCAWNTIPKASRNRHRWPMTKHRTKPVLPWALSWRQRWLPERQPSWFYPWNSLCIVIFWFGKEMLRTVGDVVVCMCFVCV